MTVRCFQGQAIDNVATLLDNAEAGPLDVLGPERGMVTALEAIARGHKVALADIPSGGAVVKLGARIGHAMRDIAKGEWVHLHNLASDLDERSATLDLHSGAPTDTDSAYA